MKIFIDGQNCRITEVETLVAGSQKQYIAETHFTSEWDRYIKFIVFSNNRMVGKDMMMEVNEDGTVEVPWEILVPAGQLRVGAYGVDGQYRRPTLWSAPKVLNFGTDAGEIGREPTVTPWERILRQIGDPMDLETEDRETVVGAVNEVLRRIPSHLSDLTGDSEHRTVSDAEKAEWSGKQSTISDLAQIRAGAAKGDTALQEITGSDVTEALGYTPADDADMSQVYESITEIENRIPSALSDLSTDPNHRTVTDAQIEQWNSGGGGGEKEWALIGTLNRDNARDGVFVDLSGCTEITVIGSSTLGLPGTLHCRFDTQMTDTDSVKLVDAMFSSSVKKTWAHVCNVLGGITTDLIRYSNSATSMVLSSNKFGDIRLTEHTIADIQRIYLYGNFSTTTEGTINVEIYAR